MTDSPTVAMMREKGWPICPLCLGCGRIIEVHADRLRVPGDTTLIELADKMRCTVCGSREIIIGNPKEFKKDTADMPDSGEPVDDE